MALLRCPDCGNNVSTQSPYCPKCGCPTPYIIAAGIPATPSPGSATPPPIPEVVDVKKPQGSPVGTTPIISDQEPVVRWNPTTGEGEPSLTDNPLAPKPTGKNPASLPENQGRTSTAEQDTEAQGASVKQAAEAVPADPFASMQGKQPVSGEAQAPAVDGATDEGAED